MLPREVGHRTGRTKWSEAEGRRSSDRTNRAQRSLGKTVHANLPKQSDAEGSRSSGRSHETGQHRAKPAFGLVERSEAPWKEDGHRSDELGGAKWREDGFRPDERSRTKPREDGQPVVQPKRGKAEEVRSSGRTTRAERRGGGTVIGRSHETERNRAKPAFGLVERSEAPWKEDGHRPLSRNGAEPSEASLRVGGTR
jgi:hypothetical protein